MLSFMQRYTLLVEMKCCQSDDMVVVIENCPSLAEKAMSFESKQIISTSTLLSHSEPNNMCTLDAAISVFHSFLCSKL